MRLFRRGYRRTAVLGILAMAVLIWAAVDQFDVPMEQVWEIFRMALLMTALAVGAALVPAALLIGWRHWRRSR